MQDARDSRRKKKRTDKIAPPPTQEPGGKHGENTARGTHPPRGRGATEAGGGKTRQGEPHQPREKQKAPLCAERRHKILPKSQGKHLEVVAKLEVAHAHRPASESRRQQKQNQKRNKKLLLLSSVGLPTSCHPKRTVVGGRCNHPPLPLRDPKKDQHIQNRTRAKSFKG